MKPNVLAEPALVGREQELETLMQSLASAVSGKGNTVFVTGEAGAGKTRLTTELLRRAREQGVTILTGWCLSNAAVPYFPFFEAFNAYFTGEHKPTARGLEEPDIIAWLKGQALVEGPDTREFSPQAWKDQTFVAVTRTLAAISAKKPLVLFIDDVHWADSASLALIHYIARTTRAEKILLIATYRSEELIADAEGRPHPLLETLRLMKREDLFKEINVTNLDQKSVSELAESMLGGHVQQELAEKLVEESQGNALFVVESLRMLHERRGMIREHEEWRLAGEEIGIPSKIKDIILQRLSALLRNQRKALDAASVIGERFDVELLGSVLGQEFLEIAETLDAIEQTTSLVYCKGKQYRFDHARSRDAIYDEVSPALKMGYHAKVAENLESMSKGGNPPFGEISHHYAQAGNKEKAIEYALAAGQNALARWSNKEAVKHFTYVVEAVGEDPESAEKRLSAMEGLGDAHYASDNFSQAASVFERLASIQSDAAKLRALRKALDAVFMLGDASHLMELVKKAEPYAAADRLENARILFNRGRFFHLRSMFFDTTGNMEAALQVFEEEYSLRDVALALLVLGGYHAWFGMLEEGLTESLRCVSMFEEIGDIFWQMEAYCMASCSFINSTLYREALEMSEKVIETNEKMKIGSHLQLANAYLWSVRCLKPMGNLGEALSYGLKALEFSEKTDATVTQGMVHSDLTILYSMLGDLKHAEEHFKKLMQLPKEIINHQLVSGRLAMAVLFAGKNRWKESNLAFKEFFEIFKDVSNPFQRLTMSAREYAWALERQGRFEEARIQRQEIQRTYREAEGRLAHACLRAHMIARRQVNVCEELEMRLDLANVGRKSAFLVRIENALDKEFKVVTLPYWCDIQDGAVEMKNRELGPFQVITTKLTLKSSKAGTYTLNPQAVYVDDMGETKTFNLRPVTITVNPLAPRERVAGKIPSGTPDLDRLLLGGIPENCAVVLASPSSDERELLIKRFLEAGVEAGETTFNITTEPTGTKTLAEEHPSNYTLIVCNPQADTMIQDAPNVFKLKGVENLTHIDIALTKAFRTLKPSTTGPRRICIDIISDALLRHHAVDTRRWLGALLPTLKSKGFTLLAVIDPEMHPAEETKAVLGLFDGEISIYNKETLKGTAVFLRIKRMTDQKYLKDELPLTEE